MTARGTSARPAHCSYAHRGALYRSVPEAGGVAASWLIDALRRGRTPLAAVRPDVETAVRRHLGATAGDVEFLAVGPRDLPGTVVRDRLDRPGPATPRPSVVGCPDPRADPFAAGCLEAEWRTEFGPRDPDEEHACLYPVGSPLERIARITHPVLRDDAGRDAPNPAYRTGPHLAFEEPALAHLAPGVRRHDLDPRTDPAVRAWLTEHARAAGAPEALVEQFVLAGLEALRAGAVDPDPARHDLPPHDLPRDGHAPPLRVRAYLRHDLADDDPADHAPAGGSRLVLDVETAGLPRLRLHSLPEQAIQGLWLANKGCPDLEITVHALTPRRCRVRVVCSTTSRRAGDVGSLRGLSHRMVIAP